MKQVRFFALLHFARQLFGEEQMARHIALVAFMLGFNKGWATKI